MNPEEILFWKNECTPVFIAAVFTIAKTWKQPKYLPTDEIFIHHEILLSHKKNGIMSFATTWMELAIVILSEVKSDRERQYHILLIC